MTYSLQYENHILKKKVLTKILNFIIMVLFDFLYCLQNILKYFMSYVAILYLFVFVNLIFFINFSKILIMSDFFINYSLLFILINF
jgi:hypothetical protein